MNILDFDWAKEVDTALAELERKRRVDDYVRAHSQLTDILGQRYTIHDTCSLNLSYVN